MRKRRFTAGILGIVLVVALSMVTACGGGSTEPSGSGQVATIEPETELAATYKVESVEFVHNEDGGYEQAVIRGKDIAGETVWEVTTESLPMAQLQRISGMTTFEDYYYYVFDGAVIALDRETGAERWRDSSFMGGLTDYDMDEAGNIYICGYLGPDYFAISKDGEVLGRVDMMDPDYMWAYGIKYLGNNQIEITYEADFYGNEGGAVTFDIPEK